jgi:hypothetical protein
LKIVLVGTAILTFLTMMGCQLMSPKNDREIWLIDNDELVLYRIINSSTEVSIPLKHKTATEFMCIHKSKFNKIIDQEVKAE